jgi:hypothetical protein
MKHYVMKTRERMDVYIQVFFTSPLVGSTVPNIILTKFINQNLLMEFKRKEALILWSVEWGRITFGTVAESRLY